MRDNEIIEKVCNGTRTDDDLILTNEDVEDSLTWLDRIVDLEKYIRKLAKEMFTLEDLIYHMPQDIETLTNYRSLLVSKRSKLENLVYKHPMWNHWLINVPGVDATFAGYLLGFIDWDKDIHDILSYCGLQSNVKYNVTLFKKIMNGAGYFISKKSPWSIHYYDCIINDLKMNDYKDYNKVKGKCVALGKKRMMSQFLIDFWVIYNTVVWHNKPLSSKADMCIGKITYVNRYDFINTPYYPRLGQPIDTRSHLFRITLKYKKRLDRYVTMYNTLCK